jgi:radical S-adenosyl methionine domain-containing protein 2
MNIAETLVSVNYHFFCKCNYKCDFCFHTKKTFNIFFLDKIKYKIKFLKKTKIKKLNFANGESFLYFIFLYKFLCYRKKKLGIKNINIILNNLKITEKFLCKNTIFIDIFVIFYDLFNLKINIKIGKNKNKKNIE